MERQQLSLACGIPQAWYGAGLSRAVESCVFPLYEVVNGKYQLSAPSKLIELTPQKKKQVTDYMKGQGRYRHLFTPQGKKVLEIQRWTDEHWQRLLKKCADSAT